ncbi:hypothetical protein [Blastopirellula marina]|uniref:Uncharacterized protein n=1 Tax=Blastopirellula marina TaxID=124 RepID=A0A2S8GTS7_9BACT|nr:hypothetical protein [Blastopirellula marina]PQO47810.1 hypothetical protein C5Y93_01850 [Blastopirellula marina]
MTKPLGQSDSRDIQDNHRTFYGQPIVVRVKDLTWQPPTPEDSPAQDAWVSTLLGEDPYEASHEDSLLMDVNAAPLKEEPIGTLPQPSPAPEKPKPQPASTTPTYLRHKGEKNRRDQLTEVIVGHSKKVLGLGGLALSLILFSYWMLAEDTSEPPVEDVDQKLFVQLGDESAPAWEPPAMTPENETITVETTSPSVPKIASLPSREDRGMNTPAQYSTPQTQLPTIGTPEVEADNNPVNPAANPAYLENPEPASNDPSGGYVPSFSPTGNAYPPMDNSSPATGNDTYPTGGDIPSFDGGAPGSYNAPTEQPYEPSYGGGATSGYGQPAASAPQSSTGNASPYPSTNAGAGDKPHWMLTEGKLQANAGANPAGMNGNATANNASQMQLPSIQNGAPQGQGYPRIETPGQPEPQRQPYYTDYNMPASSPTGNSQPNGQSNNGFSFNPGGSNYPASAAGSSEGPRSAARLGGNIEQYDPGFGIR